MSRPTLEERMAALEQLVAELRVELAEVAQPKAWRGTVGMFGGEELMKRIQGAGRKIREAERQRDRRRSAQGRRARK